jgi:thiosulfate dehydrogenase
MGMAVSLVLTGAASAAEMESSLARGGKLYDKWYAVIKADKPTESHPLYPAEGKYAEKPASNWRCKECHGWDYMGKDGAYASGKHASGIKGINGMKGADPNDVVALLKAEEHGFAGKLNDGDMMDLANFISQLQYHLRRLPWHGRQAAQGDEALRRADGKSLGGHAQDPEWPAS